MARKAAVASIASTSPTRWIVTPSGRLENSRVGAASYPNTIVFQGVRADEQRVAYASWAAEEAASYGLLNTIRSFPALWHAWTS